MAISHSSSSVHPGPASSLAEYPSSQRQTNDPTVLLQTPLPHTSFSSHSSMSVRKGTQNTHTHTHTIVHASAFCVSRGHLPKHDDPSAPASKPPVQAHRKPPTVLLHPPPLHIRGFSSHSSTSAHVRRSAVSANPVLRTDHERQ